MSWFISCPVEVVILEHTYTEEDRLGAHEYSVGTPWWGVWKAAGFQHPKTIYAAKPQNITTPRRDEGEHI